MVNLLTNCAFMTSDEKPYSGLSYYTTTISEDYESLAMQIIRMNEFSPCDVWFSRNSDFAQFSVDFWYKNPKQFDEATFSVRFSFRIEDKALAEHLHENYLKFFTHLLECKDCNGANGYSKPYILSNGNLLTGKVNPKTISFIHSPKFDYKMFHLNSSIHE